MIKHENIKVKISLGLIWIANLLAGIQMYFLSFCKHSDYKKLEYSNLRHIVDTALTPMAKNQIGVKLWFYSITKIINSK